jgi:hypothetical protein
MLNIGTFQVEISVERRGCEAEQPLVPPEIIQEWCFGNIKTEYL